MSNVTIHGRDETTQNQQVAEFANSRLKVVATGDSSSPIPVSLTRASATLTVTIANGQAVSNEIDIRDYSTAIVHMPAAWTAARLAIQASPASGGTFQPLYDELGNLMRCNGGANVVANTSYVVPLSVAGCRFIRLWSENGAGGNTNQAAARTITVSLKS